jgi:Cu/Ag efflux pump CusA
VLGGLLTSTLLNVYVIPIVYEMIHAKKQTSQND